MMRFRVADTSDRPSRPSPFQDSLDLVMMRAMGKVSRSPQYKLIRGQLGDSGTPGQTLYGRPDLDARFAQHQHVMGVTFDQRGSTGSIGTSTIKVAEDLPDQIRLLALAANQDVVVGWRRRRQDAMLTRRVPSILANALLGLVSGVPLHDNGCSLKVFRASVVKPLRLKPGMHRFLPAIASEMGVALSEVVVNHRARRHGSSKYGISRTVRVILDLLTVKFLLSYSTRPLQIFGLIGLIMGGAGAAVTGYLAYVRLIGAQSIANRPALLFGILLLFTISNFKRN